MSSRTRTDVVVVGGGVVGAASALALAGAGLAVTLVEARAPAAWDAAQPDLRVYALAPDNVALLAQLGVWADIAALRAQPYRRMQVWDAAGGDALRFDADAFGRPALGWIVENALLVDRLWAALPAAGVAVRCPAQVAALSQDEAGVRLRLDDGSRLQARIVVAADGAGSALRTLAGIEAAAHAYVQQGLVAYVTTGHPHQTTAWQRFMPGGPLALLPCVDGRVSIVWSLPDADAGRLLTLDASAFSDALTRASGGCLGTLTLDSARAAFPLRRQLAERMQAGRVLLVGDAAHVVHPLAGQGVNLGLRDVAALAAQVRQAGHAGWDRPQRLARWARTRRSENTVAAYAFEGINRVFSNDALLPTLLRGPVMGLGARIPMVAHALWRHAAGVGGRHDAAP